jgi:glycosyltransferase involved in cell wall biosynthesis
VPVKVAVTYAKPTGTLDGIRAHAQRLVAALNDHTELAAEFATISPDGPRLAEIAADARADVVNLHYNPFSYGRRGFAPWLARQVAALRRASSAQLVLTVHEAYVPPRSVRWALMGAWQRAQLGLLLRSADAIVISTESWRRAVAGPGRARPITVIPVGSNLPDRRGDRERVRAERGWGEDVLVVAALGADPAARVGLFAAEVVNALAHDGHRVVFANLGATPLEIDSLPQDSFHWRPGYLAASELAGVLAASDLFIAPYEDGVSLRRTTLAAALQHDAAVVGTDGRNTDPELRTSEGVTLVPMEDLGAFALAASGVARTENRMRARENARVLFDRLFAWPAIAARYGETLRQLATRPNQKRGFRSTAFHRRWREKTDSRP